MLIIGKPLLTNVNFLETGKITGNFTSDMHLVIKPSNYYFQYYPQIPYIGPNFDG